MSEPTKTTLRRVLAIATAAVIGVVIGIGAFGVSYAKATSYLGSDPATCANCHVMVEFHDSWQRSGHANAATCNDCHVPHGNVVTTYWFKAQDGILHSTAFTLGNIPDNIRIRESSLEVVNGNCSRCHDMLTNDIRHTQNVAGETLSCVRCHQNVGHR